MTRKVLQVALNGVTGRMGYRQHLVRSLLSIREQGGVRLPDGTSVYPEPVLVGRNEDRLRAIAERWSALAGALSGGQQKQVEFARSLMVSPRVVLLDEPSMGLDPKATGTVFEQVVRMRDAGTAVLLVEQNARRALETADLGCVLDLGRVHISGPADELLRDPQLAELYLGGRPTAAPTT